MFIEVMLFVIFVMFLLLGLVKFLNDEDRTLVLLGIALPCVFGVLGLVEFRSVEVMAGGVVGFAALGLIVGGFLIEKNQRLVFSIGAYTLIIGSIVTSLTYNTPLEYLGVVLAIGAVGLLLGLVLQKI